MDVKYIQLAYTGSNAIYMGEHEHTNAADGDPNWRVTKYTYDGDNVIKIQVSQGTWTARATLSW